jgi:peptidoglycan-associated lipoprotein
VPVSSRADTLRADFDSLERQRQDRERSAGERRDRERVRLDVMRREMELPIYFAFDKSNLSDATRERLDAKIPILVGGGPTLRIVIEGHADETGSDEYNLALGQRRAAEAKRYLVAREIAPARIDVVSFGEERPACTTGGDACLALNRRDEFRIVTGAISVTQP